MKTIISKIIFTLIVLTSIFSFSQEIKYKLKNSNTFLNKTQVDSIEKVHGNKLKFEFVMDNGKRVVIIDTKVDQNLVKKKVSIDNSSTRASIDTENMTFKDINGNIISKDQFRSHIKSGKYENKYEIEEKNGKYLVTYILVDKNEAEKQQNNFENNVVSNLIGAKFPLSDLTDMNGNLITKKSIKDKVLVFNFWFIGCKPCVEEIPQLNKVVTHFKDNNKVLFIAPSLDDKNQLKQFIKDHDFQYTIIPDAKDFREKLQMGIYPTHIIVGKDGFIKDVILGASKDIDTKLMETINQNLKSK